MIRFSKPNETTAIQSLSDFEPVRMICEFILCNSLSVG